MNPSVPLFVLAGIWLACAAYWYFCPPYRGMHEADGVTGFVPAGKHAQSAPRGELGPMVPLVRPYVRQRVFLTPGSEIQSMTAQTDAFIQRLRGY